MCLGIPGRIIEVRGLKATVDVAGVKKEISLKLLDGARVGDYVIVHAGFAIERLDEKKAGETLSMIEDVIG
ncbi:MAG: HypC/HybG/HupF family hydrogenase formation chaperone [Deltaproteobacteria bacterium]|nr:HypC/HybG/HupF family hydrogenase formation chaperone [Deltaproteobacteria bacterium]